MESQSLSTFLAQRLTPSGLYDPALGPNDYHVKCPTCYRTFDVPVFITSHAIGLPRSLGTHRTGTPPLQPHALHASYQDPAMQLPQLSSLQDEQECSEAIRDPVPSDSGTIETPN